MTKTKFNIDWDNVVAFMMPTLVAVAGSLLVVWEFQMNKQEIENMNTEARCKTVGGQMGYSKCYKNGKEI